MIKRVLESNDNSEMLVGGANGTERREGRERREEQEREIII